MTMPPTEPSLPTSMVPLLLLAITTLAGVVVYLFTYYNKRDREHTKEREGWAKEREGWAVERERWERTRSEYRAELEARYREDYRTLYDQQRKYEAESRQADADRMEAIEKLAAEANTKVASVLEKICERYIGPGRRSH